MKAKAVIYARVSSREQEETGYSLDSQVKLLRDYAERNQLEVVREFKVTESASGHKLRKYFTEMFLYIGKFNVQVVLCEKIDRLTRNPKDGVTVADWIEADKKHSVHLVKESEILDQDSRAHTHLMWDVKISIARFYANNLSEEVKKGQKEKVAQGWLPTKPPLGYVTKGEKGKKIHVIDPDKSGLIRKMFELYASGNYSTRALVDEMYKLGLRNRTGGKVGKSRIYDLLADPFYRGNFRWKGVEYKGAHESIVTTELYNLVQAKLNRPFVTPYYTKHLPVFKGKVSCGACGHIMTWEKQKGHWYGGCKSCKAPQGERRYVRQERVEEQMFEKLLAVAPKNERILAVLEKALKESHSQEIEIREEKVKALRQTIDRTQKRMQTMYNDRLDDRITAEDYDVRLEAMTVDKEEASREMTKLEEDSSHYYRAGFAIHELALQAKEIYDSSKALTEDRRMLLSFAFKSMSLKDGKLNVEYTPGFEFLAKWVPVLNAEFEPQKTVANKRQKAASATSRPTLLRG